LSRENLIGSFLRSEQRPPVNKGDFCNSPWLTIVDRFWVFEGWYPYIIYLSRFTQCMYISPGLY